MFCVERALALAGSMLFRVRVPTLLVMMMMNMCKTNWFNLDAPGRGPRIPPGSRQLALYPLPAVYLPGSTCELRNIEPRNIAMCREQSEFVASLVDDDGSRCASIGSILRIDSVQPAVSDTSGRVLASLESESLLRVQCTVVGRAHIVGCENLEAWRDWRRAREKAEYLLADVVDYADDDDGGMGDEDDTSKLIDDVVDSLYRLTDALLEADELEGPNLFDTQAAVASLEDAATLCEDGR